MRRIKVEQTINWEFELTEEQYKEYKAQEHDYEKFEFLEFECGTPLRNNDDYEFEEDNYNSNLKQD